MILTLNNLRTKNGDEDEDEIKNKEDMVWNGEAETEKIMIVVAKIQMAHWFVSSCKTRSQDNILVDAIMIVDLRTRMSWLRIKL